MGAGRRVVKAGLVALLVVLGMIAVPTAASAAAGDVGIVGPSFTGANTPTADKPQSKMWFTTDGQWWANMFDSVSKQWHIFSLNRGSKTWVDTKVVVDTRANTSSDVLWDGTFLYIGTHVVRTGSSASSTSAPMRLYRYTYDGTKFVPSASFPKTISQNSSESLTIDRDSQGTVWATWTKVTGTTSQVFVNNGTGNGTTWGSPFVVPTTGGTNPNVAVDDISTLVAFGKNRVGLLWSNQNDNTVYWSFRADSAGRTTWTGGVATRGSKLPDDHLNIKSVQADTSGRVFAAVKTSLDTLAGHVPGDPQVNLLSYKPGTGTGTWSTTTFGRIQDCHTRPQVVLDESRGNLYVFATGKTGAGTCTSTGDGAIWMKATSIDNPSFTAGSGTLAIRDAASEHLNNVTATKQSASSASGVVVLASNNTTKRYWYNDIVPGGTTTPAPVASFTASPTSGTAPLAVSLTNTSTGSPTSYSWNFGDGTTSTSTNPSHTYGAQGTYQVTLTATNGSGSHTSAAQAITVNPATPSPSGGGITIVGQSTAGNSAAVTAVTIPQPAGVVAGDVLVAQITTDLQPTIDDSSGAPAGWTRVASQAATGAHLFAYSHVVAAGEPSSYTWTLSTAVKWNAGIAAYRGVDTTTPWDTTPTGTAEKTASATTLTVPGVTTVTAGALLVGGVAVNSSSVAVTPPSGWTEALEATGVQVTEVAHRVQPAAGAAGSATWTLSSAMAATGWMGALRPA